MRVEQYGFLGAGEECIARTKADCEDPANWAYYPQVVTEKKNTQRYALWCSGEAFDSVFIQAKDSNSWVQVKRRRYGTSHDVTFADMPLVDTFQFKFRGKKKQLETVCSATTTLRS